jgi:hypothetical protein
MGRASIARGSIAPAIITGSLLKEGARNKKFKSRWCELRDNQVDYFKSEGHNKSKGSIVFGETDVVELETGEHEVNFKVGEGSFKIVTAGRTYVLKAESTGKAEEWIRAIHEQQQKLDRKKLPDDEHAESNADGVFRYDELADKTSQHWISIIDENERLRRDRKLLLQHVIRKAGIFDEIVEHVSNLNPEDEEAIFASVANLLDLCGSRGNNVGISLVVPAAVAQDGQPGTRTQIDFDTVHVPTLLEALDGGITCDLTDAGFLIKSLPGDEVDKLPVARVYSEVAELPVSSQFEGGIVDENSTEPAAQVPLCNITEFQSVFTEEQMLLGSYEALLCCTVITPPMCAMSNEELQNLENDEDGLNLEVLQAMDMVLRPHCGLSRRVHRQLLMGLSVAAGDSDDGLKSYEIGGGQTDLRPQNIIQWRWRCMRFRRPADFQDFSSFRAWALRQIALVLAGLLMHIQLNEDHAWEPADSVRLIHTKDEEPPQCLDSEHMAAILLWGALRLVHQLDYASDFMEEDYVSALVQMSGFVLTVLNQTNNSYLASQDPRSSFVPLNCMLYTKLLKQCMFKLDDFADEDDDNGGEKTADDVLGSAWSSVVQCLQMSWGPLRLSPTYHLTLVANYAFAYFCQHPTSEDVLRVLLDAVEKLQSNATQHREEDAEAAQAFLDKIGCYCKRHLHDMMGYFTAEQSGLVTLLSHIYWCASAASAAEPAEAMTLAIEASVEAHYNELKRITAVELEEEGDPDDVFENLTVLAEKLDENLRDSKWELLLRSVTSPGSNSDSDHTGELSDGGNEALEDPLLLGLQRLVMLAMVDCAVVLRDATVDSSMAQCMSSMQKLDTQLLELHEHTRAGQENERPESLLRMDKLTAPAVGPWAEEQRESWNSWVERCMSDERWLGVDVSPFGQDIPVSSSVVDMIRMLTGAIRAFKDSGMYQATSRKLRRDFVQGIASTLEGYVLAVEQSLGHLPALQRPTPPGRGAKLDKKQPKKYREETSFNGTIEIYLQQITLRSIITRINSLHFAQIQLTDKDKLRDFIVKDGGEELLAPVMVTLEAALKSIRSYLAAKVVLYDKRELLVDGMYLEKSGRLQRMDVVMNDMDDTMQLIYTEVADEERLAACFAMYRCFLETVEYILLAHDGYRIYNESTIQMFDEDLKRLEDFFHCDGDGLGREELDDGSRDLKVLLAFSQWPSPDLASSYQEAVAEEAQSDSSHPKGGMGLWHFRKSEVFALILSHRRDKDAVDFFKKVVAKVRVYMAPPTL